MTLQRYIFGTKRYRVTAPVVVALRASGPEIYVYKNAVLPPDTMRHQVESLLASGAIEEI